MAGTEVIVPLKAKGGADGGTLRLRLK